MNTFIASDEWFLLLTSKYDFPLQMNTFIASDEIAFATHLQIRIRLQTSMFVASNQHILCWGRTLLALETNAFGARDERIQARNEQFR